MAVRQAWAAGSNCYFQAVARPWRITSIRWSPVVLQTKPAERSSRERFKELLRKVGSGEHTSTGLSRAEADEAFELMLTGEASDAQIGAFLIAHRIRRPEPQELTGMVDTYRRLGPRLTSAPEQARPICFGMPFDGRKRTAPLYPLTTLVLLSVGQPVVLQAGGRMPVKYGITAAELFEALGLQLADLPLEAVQSGFNSHGLALVHQPTHFPLAEHLIPHRDDLGKRPPIASAELLWTAHDGDHLLVSGFVHPPTESRAWEALILAGEHDVITVKGQEGGTDLPISRACITARLRRGRAAERLILHPRDHACFGGDQEWTDLAQWTQQAHEALENRGPLASALRWNAGVYLWMAGASTSLEAGLHQAADLLSQGRGLAVLEQLIQWRASVGG